MKNRPSSPMWALRAIPCGIACAALTGIALGGIENGQFMNTSAGSISYNSVTQTYAITAPDGAIIHYSNFDIASHETVRFFQPDQHARVLNRVFSNDPTEIQGQLISNGVVYLTNPAGIIFGPNSVINTAQFYASTGQIQDDHFLSGHDLFTKPTGNLVNLGTIRAHDAVHLIGRRIINEGTIDVRGQGGVVTMSATDDSVLIGGPGSHYMVAITVNPAGVTHGGIGVDHRENGVIRAGQNGRVRIGAGDIYSLAIQLSGSGIAATEVNLDSATYIDGAAQIRGNTTAASTIDSSLPTTIASKSAATLSIIGDATFHDSVGTQAALNTLLITGDTTMIDDGGHVVTQGFQDYRGKMTLLSDANLESLTAGDISIAGTINGTHTLRLATNDGDVRLGDDIGGIDPLASFETAAHGTVIFSGQLVHTIGDILLNDEITTIAVPAVATIGADGAITFVSDSGDFIMGQHQKLTALGDLVIDIANGDATLGDMNAFGDMTVNANSILLMTRPAADVKRTDGSMERDKGVDFVALGQFNFSVTPILLSSGEEARFASEHENPDALGTLGSFLLIAPDDPLSENMFKSSDGVFLDLFADGSSIVTPPNGDPGPGPGPGPGPDPGTPQPPNGGPDGPGQPTNEVNLATALASAADDPDRAEFEDSINIDPVEREGLAAMGVAVRSPGQDALSSYVDGRAVYEDLPEAALDEPDVRQPIVTLNRINRIILAQAIRQFDGTLLARVIDEETGAIQRIDARDAAIRDTLERSWNQFRDQDAEVDFVRFVREHDDEAAAVLNALAALPAELETMGLSASEADAALRIVLDRIRPEMGAMTLHELWQMIRQST